MFKMPHQYDWILHKLRRLESYAWDRWLNIDTAHIAGTSRLPDDKGLCGDAYGFQTNAHCSIRKAIQLTRPRKDDVMIEIGCAKGRAVCHFARLPIKKVIGIEISRELSEIALSNAQRLRGRRAPIEIHNQDAATSFYGEGTIFFISNPFGPITLKAVLDRIAESHLSCRKQARFIYLNPTCSEVFDSLSWIKKTCEYKTAGGLRMVIYETSY
jgi:SAM-dependent methyltransferase